jgi:hypothetical protein
MSTNIAPIVLTIHHDYESGTTVEGTAKNSPAHEALKAHPSWTWSRYAEAWLLRSSRHRRPKLGPIAAMERILTDRGYTVQRDIDGAMPSVEHQETDLADRIDARQDRLAERADKWADKADATRTKADAVFDNIPMGQPMLVGHHSYAADRKRRERAWDNLGKSIQQGEVADDLSRQAETAGHHMGARYNPETVGNRIATLETERRRVQRWLDGKDAIETYTDDHGRRCERRVTRPPTGTYAQRLRADAAELDEKIAYWKHVYAGLQTEGKATTAGPDTVSVGDFVKIRGRWYRVRRVNKKSVSVPNPITAAPQPGEREWTDTAPWHHVTEHRRAADMPAEYVTAYETPGTDRLRLPAGGS